MTSSRWHKSRHRYKFLTEESVTVDGLVARHRAENSIDPYWDTRTRMSALTGAPPPRRGHKRSPVQQQPVQDDVPQRDEKTCELIQSPTEPLPHVEPLRVGVWE